MVGTMLKATLLKAAGSVFLQRQVTANPIAAGWQG